MPLTKDRYRTGQHNSESSKGQIININLPRAANVYFIWMWKFRCSVEEILERQLLLRAQAFATFSTIEKTLADLKKPFRGPFVVQGCFRMSAKDWSEWQWAFCFYGVENWLLLRIMCGTKRLNPFFRLHEASEVLDKYVMEVWSNNSPLLFFGSFIVTGFDSDIEGTHYKVICVWIETTSSVNITGTCSDKFVCHQSSQSFQKGAQFKIAWGPENKFASDWTHCS